ncbi:MAG: DinB family protein [Chitinophagaceae bacterium]
MTTEKTNTEKLFASLDETTSELLELISLSDEKIINTVPFKDSWTAAQLAEHITKSNKSIAQALNMQGKIAERNTGEKAEELKAIFLDFTKKFAAAKEILPTKDTYEKEDVIAELKRSISQLKQERNTINLSEVLSLPRLGELTKLELLYFATYHTQRHIYQLKNILQHLKNQQ